MALFPEYLGVVQLDIGYFEGVILLAMGFLYRWEGPVH